VALGYQGSRHCVDVPVRAEGVPPGWRVEVLSQDDRFESGAKTWNSGWHQAASRKDSLSVCEAGNRESGPVSVRTSVALAVYQPETPVRVRTTLDSFEVPGIGTCQFVPVTQMQGLKQYTLTCRTAVWVPPSGEVGVAGKQDPSAPIAPADLPWTPFGLLPGLSPVYRWTALQMDEGIDVFDRSKGIMPRSGLRSLIREGGEIEFRPAKRVAVLRREISVREIRFAN
jgi:hypothetical protein